MTETLGFIAFFVLATVGIFSALVVVTGKNMFHNVLFFGLFLLSVSGLYVLLSADFLAMVQIFGYVGGIVVLILFVVMLTRNIAQAEADTSWGRGAISFLLTLLLLASIFYIYKQTLFTKAANLSKANTVTSIGKMLLSSHVLPFEIVAIVLLVAIVGGLSIVWERSK